MGKLWLDIMIWNIFKSWWNPRSINKIGTGPAQSVGHWSRAPLLGRNNGVLHEDLFHQDEYKVRNYKFPFRTQNRAGRPAQRGEKRQTFCFCTNLSPVGSVRRQGGRSRCTGAWLELEGRRTFSQGCRGGRPDVNMSTGGPACVTTTVTLTVSDIIYFRSQLTALAARPLPSLQSGSSRCREETLPPPPPPPPPAGHQTIQLSSN